jgi:peroxiredoxin
MVNLPKVGQKVPKLLLDCMIEDDDGTTSSLPSLWERTPVTLIFIRHFGCIGCSENLSLLEPIFKDLAALGQRVALIGCGPKEYISDFRERLNLLYAPIEIFTNQEGDCHRAAGLLYGRWGSFGPRGLKEIVSAYFSGHVQVGFHGDYKQHAGAMMISPKGVIQFWHGNRSIGDHVNPNTLTEVALALAAQTHKEGV